MNNNIKNNSPINIVKYCLFVSFLFIVIFAQSARAKNYTVDSIPNPYDQFKVTYVVDPDAILAQADTDVINERLKLLETRTTIESAVVVLPSIGEVDSRQFANKLFNVWKIGKKDKDNGLLILLVLDQREVVFEVGYGLEGNLTDALLAAAFVVAVVPVVVGREAVFKPMK